MSLNSKWKMDTLAGKEFVKQPGTSSLVVTNDSRQYINAIISGDIMIMFIVAPVTLNQYLKSEILVFFG